MAAKKQPSVTDLLAHPPVPVSSFDGWTDADLQAELKRNDRLFWDLVGLAKPWSAAASRCYDELVRRGVAARSTVFGSSVPAPPRPS